MSSVELLNKDDITKHNWHVVGSRKYDGIVKILNSVPEQLRIGTDSIELLSKLETHCKNHIVSRCHDFKIDAQDVYVLTAISNEQAAYYHTQVPIGSSLITVGPDFDKGQHPEPIEKLDVLHIVDGELLGVRRVVQE